jgi:hypothetical protein
MKFLKLSAPILSFMVLSVTAHADYKTAGEVMDACRSNAPNSYALGYGYLMGVADSLATYNDQFGSRNTAANACIPNSVKAGELGDVFIKFVHDNPSREHLGAVSVAISAFQVAYPCAGAK